MADTPVCHWNSPPYMDVSGTFSIGAVAFDRLGIKHVLLGVVGGGPLTPQPIVAQNPNTGSWEYFATLPPGLPTGQLSLIAGAVATDDRSKSPGNLPVNVFTSAPTFTTFYVNADTGSNGNDGLTAGTPFLTLRFALESLAGVGNGGRIYLQDATNPYSLATITTVPVTTTRYLNIEGAPGSTRSLVNLAQWPILGLGTNKVHFKALTVKAALTGATTDVLWLDDCAMVGTDSVTVIGASGWFPGWGSVYCTDTDLSSCGSGFSRVKLSRGCTATTLGDYAWRMDTGQAVVDCSATSVANGIGFIDTSAVDNALVFNASVFDITTTTSNGFEIHCATLQNYTNCAFVNVTAETGSAVSTEYQVRDVSPDHFLLWNCTLPTRRFAWRCSAPLNLSVKQTVFLNQISGAGDVVAAPLIPDAAFEHCHYELTTGLQLGTFITNGDPLFTAAASNDYTPATNSQLYDGHPTAAPLVRCDQEKQPRGDPTTIGSLKGVEESAGGGDAIPASLVYSPLQTTKDIATGGAIGAITPTWQGTIDIFEVAPSIYHLYKAPPEIPATAAMAHYEVRLWEPGDPTDPIVNPPDGHTDGVVEDLRNGLIYLRNPKLGWPQQFSALSTACNLAGPFASDAGSYLGNPIVDGPTERAVVRYRGQLIGGTGFFSGASSSLDIARKVAYQGDGGGISVGNLIGWAGARGVGGGFYPLTGSPEGGGKQITLTVVGATGGNADKIAHIEMGPGFKTPSGSADTTFAPIDILVRDVTTTLIFDGFGTGDAHISSSKKDRTGRLRLYDIKCDGSLQQHMHGGLGFGSITFFGAGQHFDFRRVTFPPAQEHGMYAHAVNAGILREATLASGQTADSWFIDCVWPDGTGRTAFQFVDRPYEQIISGPGDLGANPGPGTVCMPDGRGVVLFDRCKFFKGTTAPGETASWCGPIGGTDITYIFRDNQVLQQAALGAATVTTYSGSVIPVNHHKRGILVIGWSTNGSASKVSMRINDNGYAIRRAVVLSHFDHTNDPNEKRMTFRGVEEVHIYGFQHLQTFGFDRPDLGLDENDSSPVGPWYELNAPEQFNHNGNLVYSQGSVPSFGTPISIHGGQHPPNGNVYLYMGYPNPPSDYAGWVDGPDGGVVLQAQFPSTGTVVPLSSAGIDALQGIPCYLPTGLTLNPTTGVVTGTPTQQIGISPGFPEGSGTTIGLAIDSPGTYVLDADGKYTGFARVPIKGSNPSSADAYTGGSFQLFFFDTGPGGTIFVPTIPGQLPTFQVSAQFNPPTVAVDCLVAAPTFVASAQFPTENLQVDQSGSTITVRPPPFIARTFFPPAHVEEIITQVNAPTFVASVSFQAANLAVTGASDSTDGPSALIGLRAGFEAMKGV